MQTNVRLIPSDMNDFSLRDRPTDILSTTLGEHHVQNLITLKLDEIKIFWTDRHFITPFLDFLVHVLK